MTTEGKPPKAKALFLNSYMVQVWLNIIREAGYTPRVQFCPRLACREIFGFPPHFLADLLKDVDVSKKRKNLVKSGNHIFNSVPLNLSAAACRKLCVDDSEGYMYIDIRIGGVACPNIAIPIECIVDVYAQEDVTFGAAGQGWPVFGAGSHLVCLEPDGTITRSPFGVRYEGQFKQKPKLTAVGNDFNADDMSSAVDSVEETPEQRNPIDMAQPTPDAVSNVVQFKPRSN